MLFNSLQFLLFFPIVTILYFLLPHKFRWMHLLAASCIFYMAFIPVYIFILLFTIVIDYIAGRVIENASGKRRKQYLLMSIIANVGVLCVFKYYNFFVDNIDTLLRSFQINSHPIPFLNIILPLGLSFHTFQAMSYTIEVYRGNQKAEKNFGIYSLYVMFYPQLVAGPIERPQQLLYQFKEKHSFSAESMSSGLRLILWGMFKKVVIADRIGVIVNGVYTHPKAYSGVPLIIATLLFTIQLYCDFSAYSDIAIGTARTMGFTLMRNFNNPFSAKNMAEFWRKWHISLSSWFNDYLYTPLTLGMRDLGTTGIVLAIMITFIIAGFWHGAGWNFIIFGFLSGLAIAYHLVSRKFRKSIEKTVTPKIYSGLSIVLTFLFWSFSLIFFRSRTFSDAIYIVTHLFSGIVPVNGLSAYLHTLGITLFYSKFQMVFTVFLILVLFCVEVFALRTHIRKVFFTMSSWQRWSAYYILILMILVYGEMNKTQFIYFQF